MVRMTFTNVNPSPNGHALGRVSEAEVEESEQLNETEMEKFLGAKQETYLK